MRLHPIETAPDDGTDILLFGKVNQWRERPPVVAAQNTREWGEGWFTFDNIDTPVDIVPTHWATLPTHTDGERDAP